MPVGPFPDFATCERELGKDPDVEDSAALCAWMEEQAKAGNLRPGMDVMHDVDTMFVSMCDGPAVRRSRMLFKKADADEDTQIRFCKFFKLKSEDDRVFLSAVLIPNEVDGQGEIISPHEIGKTMKRFMKEYQNIDVQHNFKRGAGEIIINDQLRVEETWEYPDGSTETFPPGTWILGTEPTPENRTKILNGELTGYSMAGRYPTITIKKNNDNGVLIMEEDVKKKFKAVEKGQKKTNEALDDLTEKMGDVGDGMKKLTETLEPLGEGQKKALKVQEKTLKVLEKIQKKDEDGDGDPGADGGDGGDGGDDGDDKDLDAEILEAEKKLKALKKAKAKQGDDEEEDEDEEKEDDDEEDKDDDDEDEEETKEEKALKKKLDELQTKRKTAKRKGTKGTQTKSLGDNINSFKRSYKGEVKKKMTSHRSKN